LAGAFEKYSTAKARVEQYDADILPLANESLELTRKGYQAGEINYLTLLIAQRTFSQTNVGFVEALGELWNAAMEIDGQLLTDSLANRSP
jgi:cobalt-zinc-cadmium efflux system outer membrane protein